MRSGLFPRWTVKYLYRGSEYRVAVSGGDGTVLGAIEPIVMSDRIGFWCKTVFGMVLAGVLPVLWDLFLHLSNQRWVPFIVMISCVYSKCLFCMGDVASDPGQRTCRENRSF